MKKEHLSRIKTFLLLIVSTALVITSMQLYQEKQENDRQYEAFLNRFYHSLDSTIHSVQYVVEEPLEGKDLEQALGQVAHNLEQTDLVLKTGHRFVNQEIASINSFFSNHPLKQFADDHTLTSEEERYLENLEKDLNTIQTRLYSDETGQENRDLSIRAFNDIITGSKLESGFLTANKSVAVPFQMIDLKESPERIQKWVEQHAAEEQIKVFLADGRTYVLIVTELGEEWHGEEGSQQVEITDMKRRGGGIHVSHEVKDQGGQSDNGKEHFTIAIAELEMETERSFQFTTPVDMNEELGDTGDNNTLAENRTAKSAASVQVSGSVSTTMVLPVKLSKDGQVVE